MTVPPLCPEKMLRQWRLDKSHTQERRRLLESFAASYVFRLSLTVQSEEEMYRWKALS